MLGLQPAADERNNAEAGTVQPLRVVDDQNQRRRVSYFAYELKGRDRNDVGIPPDVDAKAECGLEG